jgi:hypothetical protein
MVAEVPSQPHVTILFGTKFEARRQNSLSRRERARVRECNKEYLSFSPSS